MEKQKRRPVTKAPTKSPKITSVAWGAVVVDRKRYKDVKLFPGGAREWDWDETGTQHLPGILPADVAELIAHGAKVIVLSQGMLGRLNIDMDTMLELRRRNVKAHILKTEDAVRRYNELRETEQVGALIHSTC
jgi:hypothetical protein